MLILIGVRTQALFVYADVLVYTWSYNIIVILSLYQKFDVALETIMQINFGCGIVLVYFI